MVQLKCIRQLKVVLGFFFLDCSCFDAMTTSLETVILLMILWWPLFCMETMITTGNRHFIYILFSKLSTFVYKETCLCFIL